MTNHVIIKLEQADQASLIVSNYAGSGVEGYQGFGGGWNVGGEEEEGDVAHVVDAYRYVLSPPSCRGVGGID